ncbi:hypothetical protein B0T24DRAFT_257720 [Lasiosphaeria ovina]|uniref:Secreted protein n=1 Tax=Lasiosphaeria ovina TaxID=92902 RepID=A0AAE0N769_9PEZI|nr:hypothetical protein B0T24DRAFT_257720 [Lasiosphaeria ovina]
MFSSSFLLLILLEAFIVDIDLVAGSFTGKSIRWALRSKAMDGCVPAKVVVCVGSEMWIGRFAKEGTLPHLGYRFPRPQIRRDPCFWDPNAPCRYHFPQPSSERTSKGRKGKLGERKEPHSCRTRCFMSWQPKTKEASICDCECGFEYDVSGNSINLLVGWCCRVNIHPWPRIENGVVSMLAWRPPNEGRSALVSLINAGAPDLRLPCLSVLRCAQCTARQLPGHSFKTERWPCVHGPLTLLRTLLVLSKFPLRRGLLISSTHDLS